MRDTRGGRGAVLTAARAAEILGLPEADAAVLVGSGARVPADWIDEYTSRIGTLDLTFADCTALTGMSKFTLENWRRSGRLRVRAMGLKTNALRVAPAELVRAMRQSAAERNGTTAVAETPTQAAKRGEDDRAAALAACDGG